MYLLLVEALVELGEFVSVTLGLKLSLLALGLNERGEPYVSSRADFPRSTGSPVPCALSICTFKFQRLDDVCLQ
jgi:hypothetical protein